MLIAWLRTSETGELARLERVEVTVSEIVDGGTVRVTAPNHDDAEAVTLRLAGVETDGPWEPACRAILEQTILHRKVRITWHEPYPRAGGRAYLYLPDGRLVNGWLIEEGHARATVGRVAASPPHRLADWFAKLERRASQQRRGLWPEFASDHVDRR